MSQDELADKLGFTGESKRRGVTRYERGDRVPKEDRLKEIAGILNVNVKYDLKEFARNEELINLVYCECIGKNYNSKKSMTFTDKIPIYAETTKFCEQKNKFNIISQLYYVDLFGFRIEMKDNKLLLDNCLIESIKKTKKHYYYKITSNSIKFRVKKKKGSEINE